MSNRRFGTRLPDRKLPLGPARRKRRPGLLAAGLIAVALVVAVILWSGAPTVKSDRKDSPEKKLPPPFTLTPEADAFAAYAGSAACHSCHPNEAALWAASNHALAERKPADELDAPAFDPPREFHHGSQTTKAFRDEKGFQIATLGFDGKTEPYPVHRVIGRDPLRQFLTPGRSGRWHAMEVSWDPHRSEWFDVFGDDDRKPGEWGHWTGRGMVWNHMCASCHNTRLRKNYDPASDSYRTTMAEMSVGCEACHGPLRAHAEWRTSHPSASAAEDPHRPTHTDSQQLEACAACHSRREELTGDFVPGDSFWDHFLLSIVDGTDTYFLDGQVHEENYEFASFLGSKMHAAGVRCTDCHDPHSSKILLDGDALCMRCHVEGNSSDAPVIQPTAHTFHQAGSAGSACINCHMPQTTFMQRHPRHDHGFTIPDPLLTKEYGIPNACNRCHADKDADWSLAATDRWWGSRMDRHSRRRTLALAKARAGHREGRDELLGLLASDEQPIWKASAALLLEPWASEARVSRALRSQAQHPHPLVRVATIRALEGAVDAGRADARSLVTPLLDDPARSVRTSAAWALRSVVDEDSRAGSELRHHLDLNADQPSGQMRIGQFKFARGDGSAAIRHMERAIQWDPQSPPFHRDLAILYSATGNPRTAADQLHEAIRLAPNEPRYHHELGLALNEAGDLDGATASFKEAVRLDPAFGRALYNLALAQNTRGKSEEAIATLLKAEEVEPTEAAYPYARATILYRAGRLREATKAVEHALHLDPANAKAKQLRAALEPPHE